jgi:hypothetical protein
MIWFMQGRHIGLLGLLLVGLALVACSSAAGETDAQTEIASPQAGSGASVILDESALPSAEEAGFYQIVNVQMTEDGAQPAHLFIPAGKNIQLVVRNRDSTEHHYRVVGLIPRNLAWIAPEQDMVVEEGASSGGEEDESASHHTGTVFLPFRGASAAGIRPIGDEVHAYTSSRGSGSGNNDAVRFIATNTGTFVVECPLHSKEVGKVTVF